MAASTTAKLRAPPCLRYSTRVSSTPALPTSARPRLQQDGVRSPCEPLQQCRDVLRRLRGRLVAVTDAQSAAQVEVMQDNAFGLQLVDQGEQLVERVQEGRDLGDLRPAVAVDAGDLDAGERTCARDRSRPRRSNGDAELVLLEARGDIRMGLGVDVRD